MKARFQRLQLSRIGLLWVSSPLAGLVCSIALAAPGPCSTYLGLAVFRHEFTPHKYREFIDEEGNQLLVFGSDQEMRETLWNHHNIIAPHPDSWRPAGKEKRLAPQDENENGVAPDVSSSFLLPLRRVQLPRWGSNRLQNLVGEEVAITLAFRGLSLREIDATDLMQRLAHRTQSEVTEASALRRVPYQTPVPPSSILSPVVIKAKGVIMWAEGDRTVVQFGGAIGNYLNRVSAPEAPHKGFLGDFGDNKSYLLQNFSVNPEPPNILIVQ
jgi:hypothetical protein